MKENKKLLTRKRKSDGDWRIWK